MYRPVRYRCRKLFVFMECRPWDACIPTRKGHLTNPDWVGRREAHTVSPNPRITLQPYIYTGAVGPYYAMTTHVRTLWEWLPADAATQWLSDTPSRNHLGRRCISVDPHQREQPAEPRLNSTI